MKRLVTALVLPALAALSGCAPDVEDVCDRLSDACRDLLRDECVADGKALEITAKVQGCSPLFEAYLGCLDDTLVCSWEEDVCQPERAALIGCTGEFPP